MLKEDALEEDPTSQEGSDEPAYHGMSYSGVVAGELVYANEGGKSDYDRLVAEGALPLPLARSADEEEQAWT